MIALILAAATLLPPRQAEVFQSTASMFTLARLNPALSAAAPVGQAAYPLSWNNPSNVVMNRVYHGTNDGQYTEYRDVVGTNRLTFTTSFDNLWDYFVVTGFDTLGNESDYSNQVPAPKPKTMVIVCPVGRPILFSYDLRVPFLQWQLFTNTTVTNTFIPLTDPPRFFLSTTNLGFGSF